MLGLNLVGELLLLEEWAEARAMLHAGGIILPHGKEALPPTAVPQHQKQKTQQQKAMLLNRLGLTHVVESMHAADVTVGISEHSSIFPCSS